MAQLLLLSSGAGLMIVIGGVLAAFASQGWNAGGVLGGTAAGSMIALTVIELVPRAVEHVGIPTTALGFGAGVGLFFLLHDFGHQHHSSHGADAHPLAISLPLLMGISLHNVLEGVGMGAIFHADPALAWIVAAAVAVHNLPLGFALGSARGERTIGAVLLITAVVGAFQPIGALTGVSAALRSPYVYALGLAASSGLLLGVALLELLPDAMRAGRARVVSGLLLGLGSVYLLHLFHGHH